MNFFGCLVAVTFHPTSPFRPGLRHNVAGPKGPAQGAEGKIKLG